MPGLLKLCTTLSTRALEGPPRSCSRPECLTAIDKATPSVLLHHDGQSRGTSLVVCVTPLRPAMCLTQ